MQDSMEIVVMSKEEYDQMMRVIGLSNRLADLLKLLCQVILEDAEQENSINALERCWMKEDAYEED